MDFFNVIIEKKLVILIISLILNGLLLAASGYLLWNNLNYECEIPDNNSLAVNTIEEDVTSNFYVEVKGAVTNPGVYEANSKNIINDIITLAGGFTKKAYTKNINLSKKVSSELVIYVYTESEYKKLNEDNNKPQIIIEECVCPSYDITDCTNNGNSEIVTNDSKDETIENNTSNNVSNNIEDNNPFQDETSKNEDTNTETSNDNKLININTASIEELTTLSGIGESKAEAIIEYRNTNKFTTIEDIKNVSGIGEKAFEKIKNNITV